MLKRDKRPLGDLFGLTNFGVNLTRLKPGGSSALRHAHAKQDEFVYILDGRPTLITDAGRAPPDFLHAAPGSNPEEAATRITSSTKRIPGRRRSRNRRPDARGDARLHLDDDLAPAVAVDGKLALHPHKDGTPY